MTNYNDKVPAPCEHRKQTAFNRMLQPGSLYEVQLIGLTNPECWPQYHIFQDPDLRYCVTVTINRKSAKRALVKWHENDPEGHERDELNTKLHQMTQDVWLEVPLKPRTSDAEILYDAVELHRKLSSKCMGEIMDEKYPAKK